MSTAADFVLGVLTAALVVLGRWLGHVHARVNDLRERVARLEQRAADRDTER